MLTKAHLRRCSPCETLDVHQSTPRASLGSRLASGPFSPSLEKPLRQQTKELKKIGTVCLVGGGPGDPGLITVKGLACLQRADVVIHDALAPKALLRFVSPSAEIVNAGKRGSRHMLEQKEINDLMKRKAREGKCVVRLKGGDPFVFGRGGEEIEALARDGMTFEVVPGVSAALAVPAYAGIPITHRNHASTVVLVTGHERDEASGLDGEPKVDWSAVAGCQTIILFMGIHNLAENMQRLIDAGRDPTTPAAAIRWGTCPNQRVVSATLETLADQVTLSRLKPPALVVVGDVVGLREKLNWFEAKPLFGKKIVITRSREQAGDLTQQLNELGAVTIECPTVDLLPPRSWIQLDRALKKLPEYHWIIFSSVNGVRYFFDRLWNQKKDLRVLGHLKIAAIGPATAEALRGQGIVVDLMARDFRAEGLLAAFRKKKMKGLKVLLSRAQEGRDLLVTGLRKLGATVDDVACYRSIPFRKSAGLLREAMQAGTIDLLTFTSSAIAENFFKLVKPNQVKGINIASIGPITSTTLRKLGLKVSIEPKQSTIPALVEAIAKGLA